MINMNESQVDIMEDEGKVILTGMLISTKEAPLEELQMLEKRYVNQNVLHKHVHPYENSDSEVVASVDSCEIRDIDDGEKGLFITTSPLYNITDFQKKTIEYVTLKDKVKNPIKFSAGKQKFGKKGKIPLLSVPLEVTLTTIPFCEKCVASVQTMEDDGKEANIRIAELEKALKSAVGKADKFEKEVEELKKKEGATAEINSFETQLAEVKKGYEGEIKAVTEQMEAVKAELDRAKRQPLLAEISRNEDDSWLITNVYPSLSYEKLEERKNFLKEKAKNNPLPMVAPLDKAKLDAQKRVDDITSSVADKLEKINPAMAKAVRGGVLTEEEKRSLGA